LEFKDKFFSYVGIEEARKIALKSIKPNGIEEVPLNNSVGRVLAEDLVSEVNVPSKDISLFDGYAIKSSDTKGASRSKPVRLKVVREVFIVEEPGSLNSGETVYVATDAYLPKGSDTVIPLEAVHLKNGYIEIGWEVMPGQHVLPAGSDVRTGEILLRKGEVVAPQDIELLSLVKIDRVKVYRRPQVGLLPIGEELSYEREEGKKLEVRHIILGSAIRRNGAEPIKLPISPDSLEKVKSAILSAIEEVDLLVTMGGASIGKKDQVWRALKRIEGFSMGFRGIKMKPGRVTSLAWIEEKPVVLIPGHFQSFIVGLAYVLLPIVRAMSGLNPEARMKICEARLSTKTGDEKYKSFRRVVFVKILEEGVAVPLIAKSFCRKPVVKADGFIEIPEGVAHLEEGAKVDVFWISGLERIPC